ncbi:FtsX-like permease family protein [Patescibacteria group bacterium]|nr:FtsX-like permease family protein [Patescibacteria group bacterium]
MLKLAAKNLKQRKVRTFITTFGITIGIASLIIFIGLSSGLKKAAYESILSNTSLTNVDVLPNIQGSRILKLVSESETSRLSPKTIEQLKEIDHVETISPEYTINKPVSVRGTIFGQSLITDSLVMGVEESYIKEDLPEGSKWQANEEFIPIMVSNKLLDIYNFTIAQSNGLPTLKAEDFLGREMDIYVGYSSFLPNLSEVEKVHKGKIIGFSGKVALAGITVPINSLNKLVNKEEQMISKIHLSVDSAENVDKVSAKIEELGYQTDHLQKRIKGLEGAFNFLFIGLSSISLIILLVSSLSILNTFLSAVKERTHNIGIMRSVGATKKQIVLIFLLEAGIIGFIGGISGCLLGYISSFATNEIILYLAPPAAMLPESLFNITYELIAFAVIFSIILSTISAIIPAFQASRLDPIKALKG